MKRKIFILSGIVLLLGIWACSSLYVVNNRFTSPLQTTLLIRNDAYGDGYFGAKRSGNRLHNGVDFLAEIGTAVLAAKSGIVEAARHKKGNGQYIVVRHGRCYKTYYCHLSKINVTKGQRIKGGQIIGYVGKTGNANPRGMKPHLHFELHKDGIPQDPMVYFVSNDFR